MPKKGVRQSNKLVKGGKADGEDGLSLQLVQPERWPKYVEPLPNLIKLPFTDSGNAERVLVLFAPSLLFFHSAKKWLIWVGDRWRPDERGTLRRLTVFTMRWLGAQAARLPDETDQQKARKKFVKSYAEGAESARAVSDALKQAVSFAQGVEATDLDADPFLLNVHNGTVDLRTGKLRKHQPEDRITKMCGVAFDPDAECPQFLRFLTRVMNGRAALVGYLQRLFGYSLTGTVTEKAIFCFFGAGDNGKTSLLELFRYVLGDYAAQVMIETLMVRPGQASNATLADLTDLRGARFVTSSEAEEGQKLAEGRVKLLTGMGEVKACKKYENPTTFPATHKLFLDANHRPGVRGTDHAIWSRLKPIPFAVTIPESEKDKNLLVKLKSEGPGVLAWAVRGCLKWQQHGLGEPPEIAEENLIWKAESDPLKEFLEDRCELAPGVFVRGADLWSAYEHWARANGEKYTLARNAFKRRLELLGCSQKQTRIDGQQHRCWHGIGLTEFEAELIGFNPLADANAEMAARCDAEG